MLIPLFMKESCQALPEPAPQLMCFWLPVSTRLVYCALLLLNSELPTKLELHLKFF